MIRKNTSVFEVSVLTYGHEVLGVYASRKKANEAMEKKARQTSASMYLRVTTVALDETEDEENPLDDLNWPGGWSGNQGLGEEKNNE